jgi:NAD(P)-dependent dehydrogenase (short-subunit alcohol dehydrogenase family)
VTTSRSVLVTGGSKGIGLGVAQRLAAGGHKVAVTHYSSPAPAGLYAVKCDVSDPASVAEAASAAAEQNGPVEILVAAAGITRDGLLLRMPDRDWDDVIDTNLRGAWAASRAVVPGMARGRFGRLLFISSVVGMLGSPGQSSYAASKAGLIGLARSLAREYAGRGITSNVVAPGLVDTDMAAELSDAQREDIAGRTPLKRAATVDEVAAVVEFLVGDTASYVTGAVVPVDGGLGMGH